MGPMPLDWSRRPVTFPMPHHGPGAEQTRDVAEVRDQAEQEPQRSYLGSAGRFVGDQIRATDGSIGHVEDFWPTMRLGPSTMLIHTRNSLPGKKVHAPPSAIAEVNWVCGSVRTRRSREQRESAAEV